MNLTTTKIDSTTHPLYGEFNELYKSSFPLFEQRNEEQQLSAFHCAQYQLTAYRDKAQFVGFIAWWNFVSYVYVEHFAVHKSLRGKGYGSELLRQFVSDNPSTVILEIDPIVDSVSEARLKFYTKCGFTLNNYPHIHPPYIDGRAAHQLIVMSLPCELTPTQYERFNEDLCRVVMN